VDNVLLTRAHIDHSGMLPVLFAMGLKESLGDTVTTELSEISLLIPLTCRKDARFANKMAFSKHGKLPFSTEDAQLAISRFVTAYDEPAMISANTQIRFWMRPYPGSAIVG
jgi:metallo-beta-lactamase family protein